MIYRGSGRVDEAIQQIRLALARWPTAAAHRLLGEMLANRGDTDGAIREFQQALAIAPGYWQTYAAFGATALRAGRSDQARGVLEQLVALQPDNAVGFRLLGAVYQSIGESAKAADAYERAIALAPEASASVYSNLGLMQYTAGRFDEAAHAFERAVHFSPSDAVLRRNLGDAFQRLGRTTEAGAAYAEAVRLARGALGVNARDPAMLSLVAVCEAKLGHAAAAREGVTRTVALAPSASEVWYRLAVASALVGDTTPALDYLARALESGYSARLVASDDDLSSLRQQPRFRQLVPPGS